MGSGGVPDPDPPPEETDVSTLKRFIARLVAAHRRYADRAAKSRFTGRAQ